LWYAGRPIQLGIAPVITAAWKYVAASLLAGCATALIIGRLSSFVAASDSIGAIVRIAKISFLFGVLYVGAVIMLHGGSAPLTQVTGLLREMLPGGKFSRPPQVVTATCGAGTSEERTLVGG
jgi:hypothetical protein